MREGAKKIAGRLFLGPAASDRRVAAKPGGRRSTSERNRMGRGRLAPRSGPALWDSPPTQTATPRAARSQCTGAGRMGRRASPGADRAVPGHGECPTLRSPRRLLRARARAALEIQLRALVRRHAGSCRGRGRNARSDLRPCRARRWDAGARPRFCGWGSLSLWIAEHYPRAQVLAVSNSHAQRAVIETRAKERGFENLQVVTADVNHFQPEARLPFDRVNLGRKWSSICATGKPCSRGSRVGWLPRAGSSSTISPTATTAIPTRIAAAATGWRATSSAGE